MAQQGNLDKGLVDQIIAEYNKGPDRGFVDGYAASYQMTGNGYGDGGGDGWTKAKDEAGKDIGEISKQVDGTKWWDYWDLEGNYQGRRLQESSTVNFRYFLMSVAAVYGAGAYVNAAQAGAAGAGATATGSSLTALENAALLEANGLTAAGTEIGAAAGGAAGSGGMSLAEQMAMLEANGMTATEAATALGGSAPGYVGTGAGSVSAMSGGGGSSIIDTAKNLATDQAKSTATTQGAKGLWEQISDSKLVNTGLGIVAGAIENYADAKAAEDAEKERRQRVLDGAKSGIGLNLWGNTRKAA